MSKGYKYLLILKSLFNLCILEDFDDAFVPPEKYLLIYINIYFFLMISWFFCYFFTELSGKNK